MERTIMNYEFVFIFLACFILFLLISIFIKQQIIRRISMFVFSIFFVLFCFELTLSFFMYKDVLNSEIFYTKYFEPNNTYERNEIAALVDNRYIVVDNINNLHNYDNYNVLYDKKYSIYGNGFRYTTGNINSSDIYVFLGCSFTFGGGLNGDEILSYEFSKLYNFEKNVINCGVQGTSSNTSLSILNNEIFLPLIKNEDSKIKHFFYSLMEDHIYRNFRIGSSDTKYCKDKKWYVPTTMGKIKYIFARSYIFRKVFVPIIDEYFIKYYEDYMIKSLEEMNKIIEKKYSSKLTIIVWEKEKYDDYFINKLKNTNLDLIFLDEKFNSEDEGYRIKNDGHPTAKANKEIAEILYNHINKIDGQDKK